MKAISLWQPFATLIALGVKRFETRSWSTPYRGPLAIHAAKTWNSSLYDLCRREPFREVLLSGGMRTATWSTGPVPHPTGMPFGAIVAVARLTACWPTEVFGLGEHYQKTAADCILIPDREYDFGDFRPDRWAWELADVQALERPIPCRGCQGLWDLHGDLLNQLQSQCVEVVVHDPA